MSSQTSLLELVDKDMERAGLKTNSGSLWDEIQKDLEAKYGKDDISTVEDESKKEQKPADDLSAMQKVTAAIFKKRGPTQKAVREIGLMRAHLNIETTNQDTVDHLLTHGSTKKRDGQLERSARIHPINLTINGIYQYSSYLTCHALQGKCSLDSAVYNLFLLQ